MSQVDGAFWRGQRVFLTGHTGFKGGWLTLWLDRLGATVCGYALDPDTTPSFHQAARVHEVVEDGRGDVRDLDHLTRAVLAFGPTIVIHMAARALVRESYADPVGAFSTNLMGTVNLLEAVRCLPTLPLVLIVTTDKVYENAERGAPFRETDRLGGRDPYSASKATAELAAAGYFHAFLADRGGRLMTARAGNVIGGGDWARDRLLPDLLSAFVEGRPAELRSPRARRPWQHVLDPLEGYLLAVQSLAAADSATLEALNFGPPPEASLSVAEIARCAAVAWGESARVECVGRSDPRHEANLLVLDPSRARVRLGWSVRLSPEAAVDWTVQWTQAHRLGQDMQAVSLRQLAMFADLPRLDGGQRGT